MNKRLAMYREGIKIFFTNTIVLHKLCVYTQLTLMKLCQRMTLTNVLNATSYAGPHSGLNILCVCMYILYTDIHGY